MYLDNSSMELYHGRLDKRPNAIAVRIRCACCPFPQRVQHIAKPLASCQECFKERFMPTEEVGD